MSLKIIFREFNENEDGLRFYVSDSPLDLENPPTPLAETGPSNTLTDESAGHGADAVSHVLDWDEGKVAYVIVSAFKGAIEVASDIWTYLPDGASSTVPQNLIWDESSPLKYLDITNDGRRVTRTSVSPNRGWAKAKVNAGKSTGRWYFEVEIISAAGSAAIGIAPPDTSVSFSEMFNDNAGAGGRIQYFGSGQKRRNGSYANYGDPWVDGDIVGIGYDADAGEIRAYLNGVDQGLMYSGVPAGQSPHFCGYVEGTSLELVEFIHYLPDNYSAWDY